MLQPFLDQLLLKDVPLFTQWYKYQLRIFKIRNERGWPAACAYHFAVFDKLRTSEITVAGLQFDEESHSAMVEEFPLMKSKNRGGERGGGEGEANKFCSFHGKCVHTTADCKVLLADPSKAGSKAPNFRP